MIRLYNTLTRSIEPFKPQHDTTVRMYTCGPTVYNYAHIGNLRTYVFEDILRRTLKYHGYAVTHVMNITDVGHLTDDADFGEDKMEKGSRREGKTAWEIAAVYTEAFQNDLKNLNILEPTIWAKATDHIDDQIQLVTTLRDKGYTYETDDGIILIPQKFRTRPNWSTLTGKHSKPARAGKWPKKKILTILLSGNSAKPVNPDKWNGTHSAKKDSPAGISNVLP